MASLPLYVRRGLTLVPINREARAELAAMAEGERAIMERRQPRNMAQHRRYFSMLDAAIEGTGGTRWPSREALEFEVALELKAGDAFVDRHGNAQFAPWSRKVDKMPADQFERLASDTERLLCEWLGCHPDALREAAQQEQAA